MVKIQNFLLCVFSIAFSTDSKPETKEFYTSGSDNEYVFIIIVKREKIIKRVCSKPLSALRTISIA